VRDIKERIVQEFEITPTEAERDLIQHLQQLEGIRAIFEE